MNSTRQYRILSMLLITGSCFAMQNEAIETLVTRQNIVANALDMPSDIEKSVDEWLEVNKEFVAELSTRANSFSAHEVKKTTIKNALLAHKKTISRLGIEQETINHTLKPIESDRFVVQITEWRRLLAHLVYISGQGDVTKEKIVSADLNWSKIDAIPHTYITIGRLATYELLENTKKQGHLSRLHITPTYIKHIPDRPEILDDQNYVIIQEYVPGFQALKRMSQEQQRKVVDDCFDEALLRDLYNATRSAGTWDICGNTGIATDLPGEVFLCDYEPTIFNYPDDFYFQGKRGRQRYLEDVCDSEIRTGMLLQMGTKGQLEKWQEIILRDEQFLNEIRNRVDKPSIVKEYESNASTEHKGNLEKMYQKFPKSLLEIFKKK